MSVTYVSEGDRASPVNMNAWLNAAGAERANVKSYGAVGDGTTDDTTAIQSALDAENVVVFPSGSTFLITAPITLNSNQIVVAHGATIKPSSALTTAAIAGSSISNVQIFGGTLEGAATAFSVGTEHLLQLDSCTDVLVDGVTLTKSRNHGLALRSSSRIRVSNCVSNSNYGYGFEDRDGTANSFINCVAVGNGNTGTASNSTGRGVQAWRSIGTRIIGGYFASNTEYGARIYSESGDASGSSQVLISGAHFLDNTNIDLYVYNDGGEVRECHIRDCTIRRTSDPTTAVVSLQGTNITWEGGSVVKTGTRLGVQCVNLFDLAQSRISGVTLVNVDSAFTASSSSLCDEVTIEHCETDSATVINLYGTSWMLRGNRFRHGGAGASDIAIAFQSNADATIQDNEFDGFWRNVTWSTQTVRLIGNVSRNTTDVALRMTGNGTLNYSAIGNRWDTNANPVFVGTLYRHSDTPNSRLVFYHNAIPSSDLTTYSWT